MMSEEKKKQGGLNMSDLSRALPSYAPGLSSADRVGLVNALKNKLQSLAGKNTDVVEALSPKVKRRIEALKEIQAQHDELEAKFREERAALEAIYEKIYEPLYSKRYDIVNGLVEVENVLNANSEVKGVPDFWLTALRTNDVLSEEIQERDDDALKYLKDIKASKLTDSKGFKLDFFFDTNPFFKNSVLSKTYYMIDDEDPILEKATGTKIEWYPGKCLTRKILKKRPKKGSKNSKPITKTEICKSFFNFFSPPLVPEENEEIEEEAAAQLQEQMEQDYDIGSTIQNKIIPHAVSWFTGEAAQEKSTDVEDGDEDDTDEEDDDTDEYEDEEEEEEVAKRRKKPSSASKKAGKGEEADYSPECKQQ